MDSCILVPNPSAHRIRPDFMELAAICPAVIAHRIPDINAAPVIRIHTVRVLKDFLPGYISAEMQTSRMTDARKEPVK